LKLVRDRAKVTICHGWTTILLINFVFCVNFVFFVFCIFAYQFRISAHLCSCFVLHLLVFGHWRYGRVTLTTAGFLVYVGILAIAIKAVARIFVQEGMGFDHFLSFPFLPPSPFSPLSHFLFPFPFISFPPPFTCLPLFSVRRRTPQIQLRSTGKRCALR